MGYQFAVVDRDGFKTVTAYNPVGAQPLFQANSSHPAFDEIITGLETGSPGVWALFDVKGGVVAKFAQLTERVAFDGARILLDGDPVEDALTNHVSRMITSGEKDYLPLVKFWEYLQANPNKHARKKSYKWLSDLDFKITEDGLLVAYKGLKKVNGQYRSINSGTAWVNGKKFANQSIPQKVGDKVTMPRSKVNFDPYQGCHTGLHVGNWGYASQFGGPITNVVYVNPVDFCSIPTEAHGQTKLRVCRYVLGPEVQAELDGSSPIVRGVEASNWAGDVGYIPGE